MSNADAWIADLIAQSGAHTCKVTHGSPLTPSAREVAVQFVCADGRVSATVEGATVALDRPVKLVTTAIAKPWGREIWYSGMEARGESGVVANDGNTLPLSLYLSLAPSYLTGSQPLLLLKILDPKADPVQGDLYFEVHAEKREVYVVTHVDPTAWPDGVGAIRFGMSQTQRAALGDDGLRRQYRAAVAAYAELRRQVDHEGARVDPAREAALRRSMEAFTSLRELRVGDVVRVPTWLPHSLQHGVRVVEFQTPTYERYIISFAQKVLTQDRWDYDEAIARMTLEPPEPERFETVAPGVERIASFPDFNVWRIGGTAGEVELPATLPYALCMAIGGTGTVGELTLGPEEACLLPKPALQATSLRGGTSTQLLVAAPGL